MVYMINKNERIKMYYFEDYHIDNTRTHKIKKKIANLVPSHMLQLKYRRAQFIIILGGINDIKI